MAHPRPHGVAQKHGCRARIASANVAAAFGWFGCSLAGIFLSSSARVIIARCAGMTGILRRSHDFLISNSYARGLGGGKSTPGGELGVFSNPSFVPYTPMR